MRRAGLDYHEFANVQKHKDFEAYVDNAQPKRVFACTTKGRKGHADVDYQKGDCLLFGPETRGLPDDIIYGLPEQQRVRIPMIENSRSMNLSNAVAVFVYESWRQLDFAGATHRD